MSQTNRIFFQSATKMIRVKVIAKIVVAVILLNAADCVRGSRILAIFPTASYSHQIVLNEFAKQLHRRGHEIVVVTPNPNMNEVFENYTEIDISFTQEDIVDLDFIEARRDQGILSLFKSFWDILDDSVAKIYELPELRRLYAPDSGEKFDLVIVEAFIHQGLFSLAHRFDAPLIGITSLGLSIPFHYVMGNPMMTSHPLIWELEYRAGTNVPLWRKIWNFLDIWRYYYEFQTRHLVRQNALSKKYLGKDTPDIWDVQNNISLVLYNQDPVISYGRPNVPGIISFGGFHISKKLEPLQKDLKDFLDGAENGFIYMSLGTNAKSKFLPNQTKEMFLQIFSKLPQRVLWKFESDLHGKSDNIFISNWLPQQTVLSHPNIKLFIYQGGLQSTEEAIHHKVPLLGIPVLADQDSQVNRMVDHGVAKRLEILTLEKIEVEEAICELITDKRYKENMVKLNALVNDKPYDPLQNAIWWTEFVIRHKGAPHLRSTTANEFWYERFDVDVIVILTLTLFIAFVTLSLVLIKLTILTFRLYSKLFISSKQKIL